MPGTTIEGVDVDPQTRCRHYRSEVDIIAIKFKCCGRWFPCYECHNEIAGHPSKTWPQKEFEEQAIFCGGCGNTLSINEYFACESSCPKCGRKFNPSCANHYHLYFAVHLENVN